VTNQKRKYKVYLILSESRDNSELEHFLGTTWAVSENQAINNVRFRIYGTSRTEISFYDLGDDELGTEYFKAVLI